MLPRPVLGCCLLADPSSMEDAADQLHQIPDLLLLDYLASSSGSNSNAGGSSTLSSARRFACCRMLHDAIHSDASAPVKEPQALALLLVQHRRLQDSQAPALGEPLLLVHWASVA